MGVRAAEELVGREGALAQVTRALAAVRDGRGGALLVSGTAGMGKTALLRAGLAGAQDVALAWGTCVEAGSVPGYWPWTQALAGLVRELGVDRARAAAGPDAARIATIVPALGVPEPGEASQRGRALLLDATLAWLRALAAERPVVLVLDDLQWLDTSSLSLLELVVQDPRPAAVCVLAAFRHDEVPRPLQARVTALVTRAEHVPLTGLDRASVGRLVALSAGRAVPDETAEAIFRRAGGHPFFTRELALAAADGVPVPLAVRDAINRRVAAMAPVTQDVLRAAAVLGPAVLPDVVAEATGHPAAAVQGATAEGVAAGVLRQDGHGLRFAHDLFRETLADSVGAADRPAAHLAVARALESRLERGGEVAAVELARHFREAVSCGGLDSAVLWARRAADADRAALALTESVTHLRRLRSAVADAGLVLPDPQLVDVLLAEADALTRAGHPSDARGLVRAARTAADRSGDPARTTAAALAAAALGSRFAARRDDLIAELESALVVVGTDDPGLEARLTAALARELQHSVPEQRARAAPLTEHALARGRLTADPDVLAACLLARHDVLWTPGVAGVRAEVCAELVALAQRSGDPERHAEALLLHANALLECASAAFEPTLKSCLELLEGLGQPRHRYTLQTRRACLALLRGALEEGELLLEEAFALGEQLREPDAQNVRMSQRLELVRARAQPDELLAYAAEAVAHWTGAPVHAHAVAAGFSARAGDLAGARRHLAAVHDLGTWRADRSYLWSVFVRELAVAAAAVADRALCAELLEEVLPLAGTCGVNGAVVAFAGCHAHTAARLAEALGEDLLAERLHAQARAVDARLGVAAAAAPPQGTASLHRRGAVWEVGWDGRSAVVAHCKGLEDLAQLLRHPGADVHALDLMGSSDRSAAAGDLLDRTAVDSYRRRLTELADDRVEAEERGDTALLLRLDREHAAIAAELGRGTALDGRTRAFANHPAERARKAVTGRLRDAVRRLSEALPELGADLDRHLVTGVRCRYRGTRQWDVQT